MPCFAPEADLCEAEGGSRPVDRSPRATGRRICDVDPVRAGRDGLAGISPEVLAARMALTDGPEHAAHALTTGLMMSTGTRAATVSPYA